MKVREQLEKGEDRGRKGKGRDGRCRMKGLNEGMNGGRKGGNVAPTDISKSRRLRTCMYYVDGEQ